MSPQSNGGDTGGNGGGGAAAATFGLGVISAAIGGYGRIAQGQQQKAAYDYNADVTLQNASQQAGATQQKFSERVGEQASAYAAAGVDIASGSPLLIMAATAARGGREGKQIMQAGEQQSTLDRYYGKMAAFSGTMSGIGSFLNGVSSAATGYATATAKPGNP